MSKTLSEELEKLSKMQCKAGGTHEPTVEKSEEYPDGTIKYIIVCKKCKEHFEFEL